MQNSEKTYPLEEALKAQRALPEAAGLGPEQFPVQAFVGMISDEIESLRRSGRSDDEIAAMIQANSTITISAAETTANYASPEERSHPANYASHGAWRSIKADMRSHGNAQPESSGYIKPSTMG